MILNWQKPQPPPAIRDTPWGPAQSWDHLGEGVYSVSTASHGGIYVPAELLHKIGPTLQEDAEHWSGSRHWYEEDCCWAAVAAALPHLFKPEEVAAARATIISRKLPPPRYSHDPD